MNEYTPVTDLPTLQDIDPGELVDYSGEKLPPAVWGINLPPSIDSERIRLNTTALARYHRIGSISTSVLLEYQGETTQFTPGISGVNADGSAIATRAGVRQTADISKSAIKDPSDIYPYARGSFGSPLVIHALNKSEIAQNISDSVRSQKKSHEAAWADELDTGFRDSFRKAGYEHLVNRIEKPLRVGDYVLMSSWGTLIAHDAISHPNASVFAGVAAIWATGQAILTGKQMYDLGDKSMLHRKRWSLFYYGHQTDRYIALNALSRCSKLISVRK